MQHEKTRAKSTDANIVSDVYDCSAWQQRMGSPQNDDRIGLLMCVDGTPIYPGCSVTPMEYQVLSLPPQLRTKTEYMLLSMVFPSSIKSGAQKKYFDFVVGVELNPLATVGVGHAGGFTKAIVFGTPLDLPARDKFFQLRGMSATLTVTAINIGPMHSACQCSNQTTCTLSPSLTYPR